MLISDMKTPPLRYVTRLTLGRTLGLSLVAVLAAFVERILDSGSGCVRAVAIKAAFNVRCVLGGVVTLEAVNTPGVLGVVKTHTRLLVFPLLDHDLTGGISGDSHGGSECHSHCDCDHDNGQFSCHVFTLLR
jgi:hypothetical protein